jgi:hypothetical protein
VASLAALLLGHTVTLITPALCTGPLAVCCCSLAPAAPPLMALLLLHTVSLRMEVLGGALLGRTSCRPRARLVLNPAAAVIRAVGGRGTAGPGGRWAFRRISWVQSKKACAGGTHVRSTRRQREGVRQGGGGGM